MQNTEITAEVKQDENVAEQTNKHEEYLKGDQDIRAAVAQVEAALADPANASEKDSIQKHLDMLNNLLEADKNLRIRTVSAIGVAEGTMDVVMQSGVVVDNTNGVQVRLPYGMQKSITDVAQSVTDALTKYAEEIAPETDMPKVLANIVAPLVHRAALAESTLLKLRMFYATAIQTLEQRPAAILSDIVADAETLVNGTYPTYLARLQGYTEPEWNFTRIENAKDGELDPRLMYVFADGIEVPVVVAPFIGIMHTPQGTGSVVDYTLLQIITPDHRLVPVRAIGCWRIANDEESKSVVFKTALDLYENLRKMHLEIQTALVAQEKAQQQAKNAEAAGLILPEGVKSGEGPQLILPN